MGAYISSQIGAIQRGPSRTDSQSPFLRLPPEIRTQIYSLVLPRSIQRKTVEAQTSLRKSPGRGPEPFCLYAWTSGSLSLLAVNRQIRSEALEVFFGTNVFNVVIDSQYPRIVIAYKRKPSMKHLGLPRDQWPRLGLISQPQHGERLVYRAVLEEVASVNQRGLELKKLPMQHSALIRHVYVVIARETICAYHVGFPVGNTADLSARAAWDETSRALYLEKRRALLTQGFIRFCRHFDYTRNSQSELLDLEVTIFPSRNPWDKGYSIDEAWLGRIWWLLRQLLRNGKCIIRTMKEVVDTSDSWVTIIGFTEVPSLD